MAVSLAACGGGTTDTETPTATPPASETPGIETPVAEAPVDDSTLPEGPVTLRYMSWDLGTEEENNMRRQMLAAFEAKYENVTIEIVDVPLRADGTGGDYGEYLNTLASQQNLPDVFMWTSVPDTTASGWSRDVSEYAFADPDFQNVVQVMREGCQLDGKVYAFPYAMFLFGIAFNLDLLDELNVAAPAYNYSMQDLMDIIAATTTATTKGTDSFRVEDWGPIVTSDLGFGTFDGEKFNFTDPAFAEAIGYYQEVVAKGQTAHGDFDKDPSWKPEGMGWAWGEGYIGTAFEASWSANSWASDDSTLRTDLWPLPNEKTVIIPDFIYVANNTENPEWAYKLASWMTYNKEGQLARIEITKAIGPDQTYGSIPVMAGTIPEVDEFALQGLDKLPMFLKLYNSLSEKPENAVVEGYKIVPGYHEARFSADTGVMGTVNGEEKSLTMEQLINAIIRGEKNLADYAAEMERIANEVHQKAAEAVRNR